MPTAISYKLTANVLQVPEHPFCQSKADIKLQTLKPRNYAAVLYSKDLGAPLPRKANPKPPNTQVCYLFKQSHSSILFTDTANNEAAV